MSSPEPVMLEGRRRDLQDDRRRILRAAGAVMAERWQRVAEGPGGIAAPGNHFDRRGLP